MVSPAGPETSSQNTFADALPSGSAKSLETSFHQLVLEPAPVRVVAAVVTFSQKLLLTPEAGRLPLLNLALSVTSCQMALDPPGILPAFGSVPSLCSSQ